MAIVFWKESNALHHYKFGIFGNVDEVTRKNTWMKWPKKLGRNDSFFLAKHFFD
jgi:hypothetical protein